MRQTLVFMWNSAMHGRPLRIVYTTDSCKTFSWRRRSDRNCFKLGMELQQVSDNRKKLRQVSLHFFYCRHKGLVFA